MNRCDSLYCSYRSRYIILYAISSFRKGHWWYENSVVYYTCLNLDSPSLSIIILIFASIFLSLLIFIDWRAGASKSTIIDSNKAKSNIMHHTWPKEKKRRQKNEKKMKNQPPPASTNACWCVVVYNNKTWDPNYCGSRGSMDWALDPTMPHMHSWPLVPNFNDYLLL